MHMRVMKAVIFVITTALMVTLSVHARAQESVKIPNFLGPDNTSGTEAVQPQEGVQFLATLDFPPFTFLDANGRLNGFNVYLAKLLCAELAMERNCTIQGMPWDELEGALAKRQGNAAIAGIAATESTRIRYAFSRPYLRLPARFVVLNTNSTTFDFETGLPNVKIGVLAQSAFEAIARSYFPDAEITGYASENRMFADLKSGSIDLTFGDGLGLAFLLSADDGVACCSFAGGAYFAPKFLGEGMRIAFLQDNERLRNQVDQALISLQRKGKIEELYLRFFPMGFY